MFNLVKNHKIVTAVVVLGIAGSVSVGVGAYNYEPPVAESLVVKKVSTKAVKEPLVEVEPKDEPIPIVEQEVVERAPEQPVEAVNVVEPVSDTIARDRVFLEVFSYFKTDASMIRLDDLSKRGMPGLSSPSWAASLVVTAMGEKESYTITEIESAVNACMGYWQTLDGTIKAAEMRCKV